MDQVVNEAKQKMGKVLEVLRVDLATVRTGKAAPSLVENIIVSVYGGTTSLKIMELATVSAQDNQTLIITPFDNSIIGEIKKGIEVANVGFTPSIDGVAIRISIPPLSEERRQQLIHLMKQKLENGRIMIRQVRHEAMDHIKKQYNNKEISEDEMERLEKEVQKVTDDITANIEEMGKKKEAELLQI
ncbi:MAG: ribosome recycling factor [Patescibacteria group bacterium]|nr:ribosome recycling factor [Patescibacteria group bacterium]